MLPSGGLYATYHLLGEPETTIDMVEDGERDVDLRGIMELGSCCWRRWRNIYQYDLGQSPTQ